jgi:hypothetical protein
LKIPITYEATLDLGKAALNFTLAEEFVLVFEGQNHDVFDEYTNMVKLKKIWQFLSIIPIYLSLGLNWVVMIDLYLTLNNPFYPRKKRVGKFWIIIILYMAVPFYLANRLLRPAPKEERMIIDDIFMGVTSFTILMILTVIGLVINRLRKKGTSSKLRQKVIKTYLFYMIVYTITALGIMND